MQSSMQRTAPYELQNRIELLEERTHGGPPAPTMAAEGLHAHGDSPGLQQPHRTSFYLWPPLWISLSLNGNLLQGMYFSSGMGCSLMYQTQLPIKNAIQAIIFFSSCIRLCEILKILSFTATERDFAEQKRIRYT